MGALGLSHDVRTRWDDALAESQRVLDETKTLLRRKGGQRMNRIYWPHTAECLDAFVRAEREHDITTVSPSATAPVSVTAAAIP